MPLVIFVDALPYSFVDKYKSNIWMNGKAYYKLEPNIGYSSNLHWQLFGNVYPDDIGFFTDWSYSKEPNKAVVALSRLLSFTDRIGNLGLYIKKFLDRILLQKNVFANIPFRFRPLFRQNPEYLFFSSNTTRKLDVFKEFDLILDDEIKVSFSELLVRLENSISKKNRNIFISFGFADHLGHELSRSGRYDELINSHMEKLDIQITKYLEANPSEIVVIVSDHGMSNIEKEVDLHLESYFGKESTCNFLSYKDSAIMRLYIFDKTKEQVINEYLSKSEFGHLLTKEERILYRVSNLKFGDFIFVLYDGFVFSDNWFGKTIRKSKIEYGMHGFWPKSKDQQAVVITNQPSLVKSSELTYDDFYHLIREVMK